MAGDSRAAEGPYVKIRTSRKEYSKCGLATLANPALGMIQTLLSQPERARKNDGTPAGPSTFFQLHRAVPCVQTAMHGALVLTPHPRAISHRSDFRLPVTSFDFCPSFVWETEGLVADDGETKTYGLCICFLSGMKKPRSHKWLAGVGMVCSP